MSVFLPVFLRNIFARSSHKPPQPKPSLREPSVLALALFCSGLCGILSELALFNLAEMLLGGTNENLTYTVGFMLFAMGVGSAISAHPWLRNRESGTFILLEVALSLLAASSVVAIFALAGIWPALAAPAIWIWGPLIGLLTGMEIPFVLRMNRASGMRLPTNAAWVLTPDYLGSLSAFVLFGFWWLPTLGLARTAWLGGVINLFVGLLVWFTLRTRLRRPRLLAAICGSGALSLATLGWFLQPWMAIAEQRHYRDKIVWAKETAYQRVVITDNGAGSNPEHSSLRPAQLPPLVAAAGPLQLRQQNDTRSFCEEDLRLYIQGGLQFSTCDAHRYHELLIHPAIHLLRTGRPSSAPGEISGNVLVLGGGDGLAVRELLKYPQVRITLVELDGTLLRLFRDHPRFSALHDRALSDPRVRIHIGDAAQYLRRLKEPVALIVMDFPDPYHTRVARLYSTAFFRHAARVLLPQGVLVTQSFSPEFHPRAFRMVRKTMQSTGWRVVSLQTPMRSFEHWGFHLGSLQRSESEMKAELDRFRPTVSTRYLNREAMQAAIRWSRELPLDLPDLLVNDPFTLPLSTVYRRELRK